jgi:poly(3-hydroxybutyrate) depolymerase
MNILQPHHVVLGALALPLLLAPPAFAAQGEIHYGALIDQRGETLVMEYKGPAGVQFFTCDIDTTKCTNYGTTTPTLFPSVLGSSVYVKSSDGRLAVKPFALGTMAYYFLYDISGTVPVKRAIIPYTQLGATVYISKNNDAVIFRQGRTFTRYDIATQKIRSLTLAQDLAFLSISPSGSYITGYNYGALIHELWRFSDGAKLTSPSSMQSYLEFSEDETQLAFLDDVDGFKTLYTMGTGDLGKPNPASLTELTTPKTETEDYLYVGNTLYYLANVSDPSRYDLFMYNASSKKTMLVEKDVSYGDFLKRVRGTTHSYLAYLKTNGRNTDLVLYSANPGEKTTFAPVAASPASTKVTRVETSYAGRNGVLLSPANTSGKHNLFIWMHGGPQRQVALAYHPYLSYAVYDELLERLAEGGNYVYKIDYTGSSGYGADFRKALDMKIGDVEITDIRNTIAAIKKDKSIDKVYLIGNSYGGYMALRSVVDIPQLIAGAISINGVSDWYGLIQSIPSSPFKDLFNGVPDTTNLAAYFKASVFTGMDKLTTKDKVLVVWGEQDSTVPVSQSTHYIEYAKAQGVNVSSLSFPDEEHILRGRTTLDTLCSTITSTFGIKGVTCHL